MKSKIISPLKENELRKIGKFSHAHGLRGELFLYIFSGDYKWFEKVETVYLPMDTKPGLFTEFEVKSFRFHKDGLLVTLTGVDNRNFSDELCGTEVFLPQDFFVTEESDEEIFLTEIEGFEVSAKGLIIGKIIGFTYNGAHDLIIVNPMRDPTVQVTIPNYEIPFVTDFIDEINYDKKVVFMNLPEGLLELHLHSKTSDKSKGTN
jgi:16S rRNA processing protein RimM